MKKDKSSDLIYLDFLDEMLYSIHHRTNNIENLRFSDQREISGETTVDGDRKSKAVEFLLSEGYIKKDNPYSLTYKGILKLKNGFVEEYKKKEKGIKLSFGANKAAIIRTILYFIFALATIIISCLAYLKS